MNQPQKVLARSAILLAFMLSIVIAYLPGLNGPFVLDDASNIPQTNIENLTLTSVSQVAFDNQSGMFGRPIPVASFALNHYFGDGTPFAFKATNLAIHLLNSFLVLLFARTLISSMSTNTNNFYQNNAWKLGFIIAAIWALHPIQVSTVMYSVQRMTMLMTTFTLLALITYLYARLKANDRPLTSILMLLATTAFTALACLSKENGALIVLYIGLLEILIRKTYKTKERSRIVNLFSNVVLASIFITILVGSILLTYKFDDIMSGYLLRDFTLEERLGTQGSVMVLYLKNILMPNISNMNLYFDDYPVHSIASYESFKNYAILGTFALIGIVLIKKLPLVSFGIFFFYISHILESTFIPLELAFEHRNYTGTIGISIAIVIASAQIIHKTNIKTLNVALTSAALLIMSFQTHSRSLEWSDDLVLNTLAVENNPRSERAKLSLAISYLNRSKLTEAVNLFEKAAANNTKDAHTHLHLLQFKAYGGIFNTAEYANTMSLLETRPITNDVVMILDDMLTNVTNGIYQSPNLNQMSALLETAINNPDHMILHTNKAAIYARYAKSLSLIGNHTKALNTLYTASEFNPRNPEIIIMIAEELVTLNRHDLINKTLAKIPSDIRVTNEQLSKITSLTELANNNSTSVEITKAAD